jgi:hypothetical protein
VDAIEDDREAEIARLGTAHVALRELLQEQLPVMLASVRQLFEHLIAFGPGRRRRVG